MANKSTSTIHYHHPLMPDMSLRDLQPENPRSSHSSKEAPPGRLHTPLRVLERRSRRKHPPRDAKQLLPPVGAGRGGWSSHVGLLRDFVTTRILQQTSVPKPAPNPANTRETKPPPYAELLGLQPTLPCIFMVYGWTSCESATVRHWVEGYDLVHIQ